jgi:hypothetical protein
VKEATGEANMTVITVVLIGLVSVVAAVLIPNLSNGIKARSCCADAGGTYTGGKCSVTNSTYSSCMK